MDVKTLCLAVLSRRDATGYEIRKQFAKGPFAHFQKASLGAIYPALTRAAEEGLVTVTEEAQDGRPDKKVYSLTEAGKAALRRACVRLVLSAFLCPLPDTRKNRTSD